MRRISILGLASLLLAVGCTALEPDNTGSSHNDVGPDASIDARAEAGVGADAATIVTGSDADATTALAPDVSIDACPDACSTFGAARCSASLVREQCVRVGSCQLWAAVGTCDDAAEPDAEAGIPDADCYVDVAAALGGDGTAAHPFSTITAALAKTSADGGLAKRIYVFPGTYSADSGETFPLVLRNGETLEGAGSDRTLVVGSGVLDHRALGGTYAAALNLTIVAGQRTKTTRIASMTIRPPSPIPQSRVSGVLCDQGAEPDGQTVLDSVTLGPGYEASVIATNTTTPYASACHLRMVSSRVVGGWYGVSAQGCVAGAGTWVTLQIGDTDPITGNLFQWLDNGDWSGALHINQCVTGTIRNNRFLDGRVGIAFSQDGQAGQGVFEISGNRFERNSFYGLVEVGSQARVTDLSDNVFVDNSSRRVIGATAPAAALSLQGSGAGVAPLKARRNKFIGNDIGVFMGDASSTGDLTQTDFGTGTDAGQNVFLCNSSSFGTMDVRIGYGQGPVPMQGNFWDHAPPVMVDSTSTALSIDVMSSAPLALTSNAQLATEACPAGYEP